MAYASAVLLKMNGLDQLQALVYPDILNLQVLVPKSVARQVSRTCVQCAKCLLSLTLINAKSLAQSLQRCSPWQEPCKDILTQLIQSYVTVPYTVPHAVKTTNKTTVKCISANPRARASTGAEQCGTETVTVNAWPITSSVQGVQVCHLPKMSACSVHVEQFARIAIYSNHPWRACLDQDGRCARPRASAFCTGAQEIDGSTNTMSLARRT